VAELVQGKSMSCVWWVLASDGVVMADCGGRCVVVFPAARSAKVMGVIVTGLLYDSFGLHGLVYGSLCR
jgi:hypothetical protein